MTIYLPKSLKHCDASWPIPSHAAGSCALIFDLVYALKPKLSVCLNTLEASLYTTTAQAIYKSDTDGIVFAATNWINEEKFLEIQQFSRSHFPSISYMMREAPLACLRHYGEKSINCLVLQAINFNDESLTNLIAYWQAKLTDDGCMIVKHDEAQQLPTTSFPIHGSISFDEECVSVFANIQIGEVASNLINLINTQKGQALYQHVGTFIDNKNQLQRAEKTKLINQIKKQISTTAE